MMVFGSIRLAFLALLAKSVSSEECERLQSALSYSQEQAPRDLSGLLPVVVGRVNQVLEGVVDVEVEWQGGDLHGRVGEHIVKCRVTRLAAVISEASEQVFTDNEGRKVVQQCFHVPFSITDTNECVLPRGHAMQHQCREPAVCVNTIGSYECMCLKHKQGKNDNRLGITATDDFWVSLEAEQRSSWEVSVSLASQSTCPSSVSTSKCCPESAHSKDGAACRAGFQCPVDPCAKGSLNDCSSSAICVLKGSPLDVPNYECRCPDGLMGNGHMCRPGIDASPEPKVMFDGVTPTEETIKNKFYCDCTTPIIDACSGFPPCEGKHEVCSVTDRNEPRCVCRPGYVMHEVYGCVDESPPLIRLKNDPSGDGVLRLKQGDVYKEFAVDILDENAEEYLRSLKIAYSQPLPPGCLTKTGEFHVNYTVATPWTSPPFIRVTRRVIIEDIDESKIDRVQMSKICPELVPHCDEDAGAKCVNTFGSYTCKCPNFTTGDGFQRDATFPSGMVPEGYKGGTSCVDTGVPVISLKGPNPKIFRVSECSGITGVMGSKSKSIDLNKEQRRHYGEDIIQMIQSTAGAELCASSSSPNPTARDCVEAYDDTYKGRVDLAHKVSIGQPLQKTPTRWSVPYDVTDEAGNKAKTVWREIIVEEVNIEELEANIRLDMQKETQADKERAIQKAVAAERKKLEASASRRNNVETESTRQSCPPCDSGVIDQSNSDRFCDVRPNDYRVIQALMWLEDFMSPSLAQASIALFVLFSTFLVLKVFCFTIFAPQLGNRHNSRSDAHLEERMRALQREITYHPGNEFVSPQPHSNSVSLFEQDGQLQQNGPSTGSSPRIPKTSMLLGSGDRREQYLPNNGTRTSSFGSPMLNGDYQTQQQQVPLPQGNGFGGVFDSPSKITPSKRGDGVQRRAPFSGSSTTF